MVPRRRVVFSRLSVDEKLVPFLLYVAFLIFLLSSPQSIQAKSSGNNNNKNRPTAFCKLPGWPGHPAPHCDPSLAKDCCPGTSCLPDSKLAGTFTCQDAHRGQHGRKADNANPTIDDGVSTPSTTKSAAVTLFNYLSETHAELLAAEESLLLAKKSSSESSKKKGKSGDSSQQQGGFDWHQYAPPQGGNNNNAGDDKKKSQQQGDGGFDYNKYIPNGQTQNQVLQANVPVLNREDVADEDDGSSIVTRSPPTDVSKPTLPPSLVDRVTSTSREAREQAQGDVDALLRVAAQALLDAQSQLKTSGRLARLIVLSEIKAVLESTLSAVNIAVDRVEETSNSLMKTKTASPTSKSDFDWRQYVPTDVKDKTEFSTGDRRPGSLDGPCGKTDSKDFGVCDGNNLRCAGGDKSAPGTCKAKSSSAYTRTKALEAAERTTKAIQLLEDAQVELRSRATLMLLESDYLLQTVPNYGGDEIDGDDDMDDGENDQPETDNKNNNAMNANGTTTIDKALADLRSVSSSSIVVFLVGAIVLGFFLWSRTQQRRRAYRQIEVERVQEP